MGLQLQVTRLFPSSIIKDQKKKKQQQPYQDL